MSAGRNEKHTLNSVDGISDGQDAELIRIRATMPAPTPLPSLYDIGRQIVALDNVYDSHDVKLLDRSLTFRERKRLERANATLFAQEEALVDLGLAMVPETVPDVVAQLVLADRRIDEIIGHEISIEDARKIAADALHVIRSSLPLLARAAGIDLAEVAGQGMVVMHGAEIEGRGVLA